MQKIKKWFIAQLTNKPVWRATYRDGRITRLMSYNECKGYTDVYGGKVWIDYQQGIF